MDTRKKLVRDVLPIPAPSLYSPVAIFDVCRLDGEEIHDDVIAVLDNAQGQKPTSRTEEIWLPAKAAWKIDERLERFIPVPTEGLSCMAGDFGSDIE